MYSWTVNLSAVKAYGMVIHSYPSALNGVRGQRLALSAVISGKHPRYPFTIRVGGPRNGLDALEGREIF